MPTETTRARKRARDRMNGNARKRPLLEMSACVVLVATLAVQPALGRDGGRDKHRDGGASAAQAQTATAAPAARRTARGSTSSSARRTARQAPATPAPPADPAATAAPDPAPAPAPPPVVTPPVDPPTATPPTTAGPEDGATGAPPPVAVTPTPADPAPAPPPPVAAPEQQPPRTPTPAENAVATPTPAPASTAGPEDRDLVTSVNPGSSSPPATSAEAAAAAPLDTPAETNVAGVSGDTGTPAASGPASGAGSQPTSDRGSAQARGARNTVRLTSDAVTGGAAPATALSEPLRTPASTAILGIVARKTGADRTSQPQRTAVGDIENLSPNPTLASRVSDVVNVVPKWMWIALALLAGLVLLLGAHTVLAAARTKRLQRHREKLMEDIGLLQAALLPAVPSRMGALMTTVAYRPADGPAAGGDFYDAFPLPDGKVALLLGDVSGHGRQALAKTTLVRFTVRAHLEAGMSPREAIAIAGRSLDGRLADDFSTVVAAIHDPATGTLTYASAGHPPPLVLGPSVACAGHRFVRSARSASGFPTGQRQTVLPMPEGTTVASTPTACSRRASPASRSAASASRAWLDRARPGRVGQAAARPRRPARRPRPRRPRRRRPARRAGRHRPGGAGRAAQARRPRRRGPGARRLPRRLRVALRRPRDSPPRR